MVAVPKGAAKEDSGSSSPWLMSNSRTVDVVVDWDQCIAGRVYERRVDRERADMETGDEDALGRDVA